MRSPFLPLCICIASALTPALAEVRLATVFSDHMVLQRDVLLPIWGTADPNEKIRITLNHSTLDAQAGPDGKWLIRFPPLQAGGPFALAVTGSSVVLVKDVYAGEVWLGSGQSNMDMTVAAEDRYWCGVMNETEEVAAASYPLIRMFKVKLHMTDTPQTDLQGQWMVTTPETVKKFSATGYFFARELYKKYQVPIGFIDSSFGASTAQAWISREQLEKNADVRYLLDAYTKARAGYEPKAAADHTKFAEAQRKWTHEAALALADGKFLPKGPALTDPGQNQHNPAVLFNGMIAPLIPYAIRGAVWYQGESNEDASVKIYRGMMESLVADWRTRWGQGDFPFLYVQLAALGQEALEPATKAPIAQVREAQLQNLSIPNTGMVVTIDIGDAANVHPKNKQELGRRLALLARNVAYHEKVVAAGPLPDTITPAAGTIRVRFKNAESGLAAHGGTPIGFAIAGSDQKFYWAKAKIEGDSVVLATPEVGAPVEVRYGWADNPPVNLYNKDGLPASPFRMAAN